MPGPPRGLASQDSAARRRSGQGLPKATSEASLALTATRRAARPRGRIGKNATYSCFRRTEKMCLALYRKESLSSAAGYPERSLA